MSCPYFVDARRCRCSAVDEELVPSIHERTLHCRADFESCPTYVAREAHGAPIPLRLYERLWFAPGADAEDSLGA